MYLDKPLREYLDDLAVKKPAPGGGSAAAVCGALGAGLLAMVGNYTISSHNPKASEEKIVGILARAEKAREELEDLIDLDIKAYTELSAGLKSGKKESVKLQDLYKKAADTPFEICKLSAECLRLCPEMIDGQNKNLITDTACAAIMLESSFFAAKFNVCINLKYIKDLEYVARVHRALAELEDKVPGLKEEVVEKCEGVVK